MTPPFELKTALITLSIVCLLRGIYLFKRWLQRRKDQQHILLSEYNELMRKSGYTRSRIGNIPIWIPPPTLRPKHDQTESVNTP